MKAQVLAGLLALFSISVAWGQVAEEPAPPATGEPLASAGAEVPEAVKPTPTNADYLALPIFFYTPDTGFAWGGAGVHFHDPLDNTASDKPSSVKAALIYTQKRQFNVSGIVEEYLAEGAITAYFEAIYKDYPDQYFGIGPETPEEDREVFTSESIDLRPRLLFRVGSSTHLGPLFHFVESQVTDVEPGKVLERGEVLGARGSQVAGLGGMAVWDSRDDAHQSSSGAYHQVLVTRYADFLGSDHTFTRIRWDGRRYFPLTSGNRPQVLAMQVYGQSTFGNAPFEMMSLLGGSHTMRGYLHGRYRDKHLVSGQAEYRAPLFERFGFVAFGGLGDVAPGLSDFGFSRAKPSYGLGFRYLASKKRKANVRLDMAFGRDSRGVYVHFLEAF